MEYGARAAALLAAGRLRDLERCLADARADRVPRRYLAEGLLQSYLFLGFPRALQGLEALTATDPPRRAGAKVGADSFTETPDLARALAKGRPLLAQWWKRGESTCRRVYGPSYDRLRVNIARLHPELADWMIAEGYGKVLGRPILSLAEREAWILPILVVLRADRQLRAHIDGARRVGLSPRKIEAVIDIAGGVSPVAGRAALRLWRDVTKVTRSRSSN